MTDAALELLQFPYSHYNEKARWALDFKRAPHTRTSFLPGPHAPAIKRLTGKTTVPVLRAGGEIIAGSARIIDELERRFPDPPLYPRDPAARTRAREIQTWFDDEVGPWVRRGLFAVLITEPGYLCWIFSSERNVVTRALYRATFPLAKGMMKSSMGITDQAAIDEAHRGVREALDFVAREAGSAEGQLVGDTFTVADLAAAALLAPAVMPPGSPMDLPGARPAAVTRWLDRWADHPGAAWVRAQFRKHRPAAAAAGAPVAPPLRQSA
jgi:glutathione S-transferase